MHCDSLRKEDGWLRRHACREFPLNISFRLWVVLAGKDAHAQRDDARSRKPGLRAAPPKSRKLQQSDLDPGLAQHG